VTKKPLKNIATSVHQRLLNEARNSGRPFNELLQYFSMERFLYRLSQSPHAGKFLLKGALMLTAWRAPLSRPTMDIDLLGHLENDVDAVVGVLQEVCAVEVEPDAIVFHPDGVRGERIIEAADYEGVRVRFSASLGSAKVFMQVDVGFGDVVVPSPKLVDYPSMLDFPAPRLRGYTRESTVAEKFEAMTKLGMVNSRMKDFYDIWLLSRQFDFDGKTLAKAIKQTFDNRGTRLGSQPVALTSEFGEDALKQAQWRAFLVRNRLDNAPSRLADVVTALTDFLGPVAAAVASGRGFRKRWQAPGPWAS